MATEKILIFDEAGNAKRMKVRIARFLENEPVTDSDKENIRTTLDVDDSLSGTFTTPLSVTSASDSSFTGGGSVGIGAASPLELLHLNASAGGANNRVLSRAHYGAQYADHALVLGYCVKADTAANSQMVVTESSGSGAGGNPAAIRMKTGAIEFHTAGSGASGAAFSSQRWAINPTGNLVANSTGIDFGGGASTTLDSYEEGTWAGTYAPQTGTFATMTMDTDLVYTKTGNLVHVSGFIRTDDVDITGGSNGLKITGLPFTCAKPSAVSIGFAWNWGTAAPLVGYIGASGDAIWLQTRAGTTARTDGFNVSNMSTGTSADRNILYLEATYQAS